MAVVEHVGGVGPVRNPRGFEGSHGHVGGEGGAQWGSYFALVVHILT